MYKDIISYQLADNIDEAHLLKVANDIIENWMKKQPGFIRWDIHKNVKDDSYTDIVYWESQEDAKKSEGEMMNIPNGGDWFACYKEGSINCLSLKKIETYQ